MLLRMNVSVTLVIYQQHWTEGYRVYLKPMHFGPIVLWIHILNGTRPNKNVFAILAGSLMKIRFTTGIHVKNPSKQSKRWKRPEIYATAEDVEIGMLDGTKILCNANVTKTISLQH